MDKTFYTKDLKDAKAIAKAIAKLLTTKTPLLISGEVGVGKTTFVQLLAPFLGCNEVITSPSYTIMKIYETLVHLDAYRISGDLASFEEYFNNKFVIIEWPEKIEHFFSQYYYLKITQTNNQRKYELKFFSNL